MQQTGYQVRFGMGVDGLRACAADADVIIWVDALPAVVEEDRSSPAARDVTLFNLLAKAPAGATLVGADVSTSRAAAHWVLDYQNDVQRRLAISVITASDQFAVEDFLCAGSVIDALSELGLDATSPEAAAAESAYRGLRNAVAHLVTASVAGREQQVPDALSRINPRATAADVTVIRDARA
jgi:hypothetical protein